MCRAQFKSQLVNSRQDLYRGFTLIEIMIVVVILGILSAIIIPSFANAKQSTDQTAFVAEMRIFGNAAMLYMAETNTYLEDTASGVFPAGWDEYTVEEDWIAGTPIGGAWDFELNSFGVTSAFGVHFNGAGMTRDDIYMTEVDAIIDDGDLATGVFQKIAGDRYYFILKR